MIPAGVAHDPVASVVMRDGRAARLPPAANVALRAVIQSRGAVPEQRAAGGYALRVMRKEIRRAGPALARLHLAFRLDGGRVDLVDATEARR